MVEGSSGDQMRERYEQLKLLRVTQPEREAAAARKALEKVTSSSDELVASLRAQLAAAQGQGGDGSSEKALRAENADLRKRLEAAEAIAPAAVAGATASLEAKVGLYELMTGMRVEIAGDVAKCVVTCAAPSSDDEAAPPAERSAAFELNLAPAEGDEGDIEYVPTDLSGLPVEQLPEYLRESILFEGAQAPAFLRRLLSGVAVDC